MPKITAQGSTTLTVQGKIFTCPPSADLRQILVANSIPVHNDQAALINCRGLGTFLRLRSGTSGTCAVEIEGEVSPPTIQEPLAA